jgi:hypothetical protein
VAALHLLPFTLEPQSSHFKAGPSAEFHPEYMQSVVVAGRCASPGFAGMVVGFAGAPRFKLCDATVVASALLSPHGASVL